MRDIEIAKKTLKEKNLTLTIAKNGRIIFESRDHGIIGLINAIEKLREELNESSIADKIMGKAAALLAIYMKAKTIYTAIISRQGLKTLMENNIEVEYDEIVEAIMDKTGRNICPFELKAQEIQKPEEAYEKFKSMIEKINFGK